MNRFHSIALRGRRHEGVRTGRCGRTPRLRHELNGLDKKNEFAREKIMKLTKYLLVFGFGAFSVLSAPCPPFGAIIGYPAAGRVASCADEISCVPYTCTPLPPGEDAGCDLRQTCKQFNHLCECPDGTNQTTTTTLEGSCSPCGIAMYAITLGEE